MVAFVNTIEVPVKDTSSMPCTVDAAFVADTARGSIRQRETSTPQTVGETRTMRMCVQKETLMQRNPPTLARVFNQLKRRR